jgi:hypothetical protein
LARYDAEMRKFGYSLSTKDPYLYAAEKSVFDPWDLGATLAMRFTPSDLL